MEIPFGALLEQPRRLLTVAVATVAAILIGSELYALLNTALTPTTATSTRNASPVIGDPIAVIAQAGLFGAAALSNTSSNDAGLPQTSAQLILRGVFTGGTPEQGSAIFELPDGSTRMVRAGGSLDGGVVLERIYASRVVLNRNGLQENLSFPSVEEYAAMAEVASQDPAAAEPTDSAAPAALNDDEKRANIMRRLEELRARSLERNQG